jgi:peroxiredoxin
MKRLNFLRITLFLIIIVSFTIIRGNTALAKGTNFLGKKAPEISISGSFNAKEKLSLSNLRGKVVLVEFWATWCPPCRASISHLSDLYRKYTPKGLVIIAITAEDKDKVKDFVRENKMRFPVAIDKNRQTNSAYGIRSIPTAYLIDSKGKVIWQGHTMQLTESIVEDALKSVKSQPVPVW